MWSGDSVARIKNAVLDTGPLTHLGQIDSLKVFRVFQDILLSEDVVRELGDASRLPANCKVSRLKGRAKDMSKLIMEEYGLGAGESTAIALAKQEGASLVFTDDLEAREVARSYGLEPHGTLAIVTRTYREHSNAPKFSAYTGIPLQLIGRIPPSIQPHLSFWVPLLKTPLWQWRRN